MTSLTHIYTVAFQGLNAVLVEVEVDLTNAQDLLLILVGLPSAAVKESKDRVVAALRNVGHPIAAKRCTVNLAPAELKKEGAFYDLPIALGLLSSMGKISHSENLSDYLIVGELGLSGELRPIRGALAIAMLASALGKKGVILPEANAKEASAVPGIFVKPVKHLKDAITFFQEGAITLKSSKETQSTLFTPTKPLVDFKDIKGQQHVKRAMEIAAAGGHNIVLYGPPGTGKTMMAKAIAGIMPELSVEEALETTKIHSIAGLLPPGESLITQRPFRSPHHTVSYAGLIGGGSNPRPGEVTLAHNGILFLDELPEFSRTVLEVLRQPLEDRKVTISRANGNFTYPTNFTCVAAMNPCPCGYLGHPDKPCRDTQMQIDRYRGKISGPLWDRMDMHVEVPALRFGQILDTEEGESSSKISQRVNFAREKQKNRLGGTRTNAEMSKAELNKFARLNFECNEVMRHAIDEMGVSARAVDRLIRISRTIADMENSPEIKQEHLMEALNYRRKDV